MQAQKASTPQPKWSTIAPATRYETIVSPSIQLKPGDIADIPNGSLRIPNFDNPYVEEFTERAKTFSYYYLLRRDTKDQQDISRAFNIYVNHVIKYDDSWYRYRTGDVFGVEEIIQNKAGVCKDQSAVLYMMLRREDMDAYYCAISSLDANQGHTFIKIKINNEDYLADPTSNIFGEYGSTFDLEYKRKFVSTFLLIRRPL